MVADLLTAYALLIALPLASLGALRLWHWWTGAWREDHREGDR